MKRLLFSMLLAALLPVTVMAQDDELVTPMPYINIVNNGMEVYVTLYDDDPYAVIYYSFATNYEDFSDWIEYQDEIVFTATGDYTLRTYAISPGMSMSEIVYTNFHVNGNRMTIQPMAYANQVDDERGLKVYFIGDPRYYYYLIPGLSHGIEYSWPKYINYQINGGNWRGCNVEEPIYLPDYGDYIINFTGEANGYQQSLTVTARVHYDAENYYSNCNGYIVYNGVVYYLGYDDDTASVASQQNPVFEPSFYVHYEGDIVIPEVLHFEGRDYTVTSINDEAFAWFSSITGLSISKTVTYFSHNAFLYNCTCLTLNVAEGNPRYDSRDNCNAVIETASNKLIQGCLGTVIPSTVTTIGKNAFCYQDITSIDIPNSVTTIEESAFERCQSLTSLTIPGSVASIGRYAFAECTGLTYLNFLDGFTTINEGTFMSCIHLASVNIPSTVTAIERYAFKYSCLARLTCHAVTPPSVASDAFDGDDYDIHAQATLFVPNESLEAYKAHEEWSKFEHIVPFIGAGPGDVNGDGSVSILDATGLIDMLLCGEELPAYADVNGDGIISIIDITALIDMLLSGNF